MLDSILGTGKDKGQNPDISVGNEPYGMLTQQQGIDPAVVGLLNSPQIANAQVAQFATNNNEVIQTFREGLQGYRIIKKFNPYTGKEEQVKEVFGVPALNDTGVNELCRELEMYLNKTFILSNVPEKDRMRIDSTLKIVWKALNHKLIVNATAYALDKTRRPDIIHSMVFTINANIMRGYEDGERGKFYGSQRTLQTINQTGGLQNQAPPQKRSLFGI